MVLEHAVLQVRAGEAAAFEEAFGTALPLIAASPGCRSVRLERCVEDDHRYLLLVEWESLADHTVGFRGSPAYERWRELLHHFYEPFPAVEHFVPAGRPSETPVELHLEPMSLEEVGSFKDALLERYISERVGAGEPPEQARSVAVSQHESYYPGGLPGAGHRHYRVMAAEERVGSLWIGPAPDDTSTMAWVYFVEVHPPWRGRGLAGAVMALAEEDARAHGSTEIGLNVFGGNVVARRAYRSAGYEEAAIRMRKQIG